MGGVPTGSRKERPAFTGQSLSPHGKWRTLCAAALIVEPQSREHMRPKKKRGRSRAENGEESPTLWTLRRPGVGVDPHQGTDFRHRENQRRDREGGKVSNRGLAAKSVCDITKAYAHRVLDGAAFGAHSLRSGFLTCAARRGASVFKMRDVSRHKSMDVLQAYVRDADLLRDHAGAGLL
jgi:hypothetical protein